MQQPPMAERQLRTDDRMVRAEERTAQAEERRAAAAERMACAEDRHNDLRRHTNDMDFELSKSMARVEAVLTEPTKVLERLRDALRQQLGFGRPAQS